MADPAGRYPAGGATEASVGSLVSLAVKDVTALVRYELDLAKLELKADVRRLGVGGALLGVSAFIGCLVLMLLCFALAYGLIALGIWAWAAFLITAGACVLLAALAIAVGVLMVKRLGGLPKTRRTVQDDLAIMRRGDGARTPPPAQAR
ncbi:MAG TPA: phage holin family protein [Streptosporangiaceae bacterium]|nr:phage holin family protein [Streptosporangiaceae bacterium]